MLKDSLKEGLIELDAAASTPEEAIENVGRLLLSQGKISKGYIDSMIETLHNYGPYMVIAPGIAIPHGQPGELVKEDCIAFCRLKNPVEFGNKNNDPVRYLFAIGSNKNNGHLDILKELSTFLMNENNIDRLGKIKTKSEFMKLIEKEGTIIERS